MTTDAQQRLDAATARLDTGANQLPHSVAAAIIGTAYRRYLRCCEGAKQPWRFWNGNRWQSDGARAFINDIIRQAVYTHFQPMMTGLTPHHRANMLSHSWLDKVEKQLQLHSPLLCKVTDFDADPWLLGTPRGTVDLRTGRFSRPEPEQMISMQTAVDPAPKSEKTPMWTAFLKWMTCSDAAAARFLRMWNGVSLIGHAADQRMLFMHGDSANGKSVFLRAIGLVAGSYHATAAAATFMQHKGGGSGPNPNLVKILGARLVTGSEIPKGAEWDNQIVKMICSDEQVEARKLYENDNGMAPRCSVSLSGNDLPMFTGLDDAVRRRFRTMHCKAKRAPNEQVLDYGKELVEAEGPGILRWGIEGALDRYTNGFIEPEAIAVASREYFDSEDTLAQFMAEEFVHDAGHEILTRDAFRKWVAFNQEQGRPRDLNTTAFVLHLKRMGFTVERESTAQRRSVIKGLRDMTFDEKKLGGVL